MRRYTVITAILALGLAGCNLNGVKFDLSGLPGLEVKGNCNNNSPQDGGGNCSLVWNNQGDDKNDPDIEPQTPTSVVVGELNGMSILLEGDEFKTTGQRYQSLMPSGYATYHGLTIYRLKEEQDQIPQNPNCNGNLCEAWTTLDVDFNNNRIQDMTGAYLAEDFNNQALFYLWDGSSEPNRGDSVTIDPESGTFAGKVTSFFQAIPMDLPVEGQFHGAGLINRIKSASGTFENDKIVGGFIAKCRYSPTCRRVPRENGNLLPTGKFEYVGTVGLERHNAGGSTTLSDLRIVADFDSAEVIQISTDQGNDVMYSLVKQENSTMPIDLETSQFSGNIEIRHHLNGAVQERTSGGINGTFHTYSPFVNYYSDRGYENVNGQISTPDDSFSGTFEAAKATDGQS